MKLLVAACALACSAAAQEGTSAHPGPRHALAPPASAALAARMDPKPPPFDSAKSPAPVRAAAAGGEKAVLFTTNIVVDGAEQLLVVHEVRLSAPPAAPPARGRF